MISVNVYIHCVLSINIRRLKTLKTLLQSLGLMLRF